MEEIIAVNVLEWPLEGAPEAVQQITKAMLGLSPTQNPPKAVRFAVSNYETGAPSIRLTRDMPESIFKQIEENGLVEDLSCAYLLNEGPQSAVAEIPREFLPINSDGALPNEIFCSVSKVRE